MQHDAPEDPNAPAELPAIEFDSPGRFAVYNPQLSSPPGAPAESVMVPPTERALQRFTLPEQAREHVLTLIGQARHALDVYSPDLEPWLYNHGSVQDACCRFLLAHPRNRMRILVGDTGRAVRDGHQLLALSRRLTSKLHIRKLNPDHPGDDGAFLVVDNRSLLVRPVAEQQAGYALYNDPGRARQKRSQFAQAWDHSLSDPDLRSFLL